MRLLSIKINNFRVIKSAEIDFPDKVIAIVGKNGSGKSSIIEAISWALYGNQAARSGKDEIKSTFASETENCEVIVHFLINEERFTVIRRLVGRTHRAEVEFYRGDKSESVGVNETKTHVGNLLGLDWRGFLSSFLARQSELNALSDLVPSKRKDHIAGMLGIEKLDKAMQSLKADTKLYKERVEYLERTLVEKQSVDQLIDALQKKIQEIELLLEPQKKHFEAIQDEFKTSKQDFEDYNKKKIQFLKTESELKAQKSTLELQQGRLKELLLEKTKLLELQNQLQELQLKQETLHKIPTQLEQLKKQKSNKQYVSELKNQHQGLLKKIEETFQIKTNLEKQLEDLKTQLQSYPENIEQQHQQQKLLLDEKRSLYSSLQTEIKRLHADIEKLRNQSSNINSLKSESVCDRCHRPLGDDFESIKQHIEDEISQLNEKLESKSTDQKRVQKEGEELKVSSEKLDKQHKEHILLKPKLESVTKEIAQNQKLEIAYQAEKIEILQKISEIGDIEFDEKDFVYVTEQFELYQQNKNRINRYLGQLERLPGLLGEIEKSDQKIISTQQNIADERKNADAIGYSEEEFEKQTVAFNTLQSKYDESKNKLFEIQKEHELTLVSLKEKQHQQEVYKKSVEEYDNNKSSHYYGEKLSSLFSAYRHDLIASIRPTLADQSSRLFNEMTSHKYNLVELDEKYELRVMDDGQFYGVERFSGGEKDLANLCLRLAISLSLTETAGLSRSFIILDEVFGSQDNERKTLILSSLANLKNRFPQIILITHIEDIKDGVEQIIEVKQNEYGFSEVVVHGS